MIQKAQNRILKIISKNTFQKIVPLNLQQAFAYDSLMFHYNKLKEQFINSTSITRNKTILLPKYGKTISTKDSYIKSINTFNALPNDLKILDVKKKSNMRKIKDWISQNG